MAKSNFYLAAKRSEYRNNYLPFDYYDFWITAKENENLRCQNKIRDYVHTPFDWDEDQDFYLESNEKFQHSNQATQTSERSRQNRKSKHVRVDQDKENHEVHFNDQQHQHAHRHHQQQQQQQQQHRHRHNHLDLNEHNQPQQSRPHSQQRQTRSKIKAIEPEEDSESSGHLSDDREPVNEQRKKPPKSTKNTGIQIHIPESRSFNIAKPRKVQSGAIQRSKSNAIDAQNKKENFNSKSITNMSVQTPPAWTLRDYQKSKPSKNLHRSASAAVSDNLKPKRAPFANYGWATQTKDLSNKPTHNALANQILAAHNNKDAIIELTLQKIKKNANLMANEYSAIESNAAEFHHHGRSESRVWNSEYGEKYPDYSRSPSRNEIYMAKNPYRLNKSSLISNYPQLRRGPKSAARKVYYVE